MSAKNARLKRRCAQKVTFSTLAAASAAAWSLRTRKGDLVHGYKCGSCGAFHVGHPPKRVKQAIRDRRRNKEAVK